MLTVPPELLCRSISFSGGHTLHSTATLECQWRTAVAMALTSKHTLRAATEWMSSMRGALGARSSSAPHMCNDNVASKLARSLYPGLTHVDLGMTRITDACVYDILPLCATTLVHVDLRRTGVTGASIIELATACPLLMHVDVSSCANVTDSCCVDALARCPMLAHVYLRSTRVTDVGVIALALACPYLRYVDVSSCASVTDSCCVDALARCPMLAHVDLRCTNVTDVGVGAIASGCLLLTYVDASFCNRVTGKCIGALATCPMLTHVSLCRTNITDDGVSALGTGCRLLKCVNFSMCTSVTDDGVCSLAQKCPMLTHVLLGHTNVGDAGVLFLIALCPRLRHINLCACHRVTDVGVEAIGVRASALTHVVLQQTNVTDVGVVALARCVRLEHINLSSTQTTDVGVEAIAKACSQLIHLSLSCRDVTSVVGLGAGRMSNAHIAHLGLASNTSVPSAERTYYYYKHLEHVNLAFTHVGDDTVCMMTAAATKLEHVSLSYTRITDLSVVSLATRCRRLTHISVTSTKVTDVGVVALATSQCATLLMHVALLDTRVSDVGIRTLATECRSLASAFLPRDSVSDATVQVLLRNGCHVSHTTSWISQ